MSFWQDLGVAVTVAYQGAVRAGKQLIKVTAPIVRRVIEAVRDGANEAARRVQRMRGDADSEREVVERQLQEVNARIARLRTNHLRNGQLTKSEKAEWHRFKARRELLIADIEQLDSAEFAVDIVDSEDGYASMEVTDRDAHLIDMVTGQSTFGKKCRHCLRTMVLQWNRAVGTPGLRDFFWGCSGWYIVQADGAHACNHKERLGREDFNIFANVKRPEFQVTAEDLSRRVLDPARKTRLREALDGIRMQNRESEMGVAHYRCPVHGEALRMQRKNVSSDDLLDQYFLGCPRWQPQQRGCNFLIKLKSPGRISAVMQETYGHGAIEMLDA